MNRKHLSLLLVFATVISLITVNQLIIPQEKEWGTFTWTDSPIRFGLQAQDPELPASLDVWVTGNATGFPERVDFELINMLHQTWIAIWLYNNGTWINTDRFRTNVQGDRIGFQDPVPEVYVIPLLVFGSISASWGNVSYIPCCDIGTVIFGVNAIVEDTFGDGIIEFPNVGNWTLELRYD